MNFLTQLFRQDAFDLAAGRLCSLAILSVEVLRHKVAAQQEHGCLVCCEAERWQEVAFHQGVAASRRGDERHAGLA